MYTKSISITFICINLFFGCSDPCYREPLTSDELLQLFELLGNDEDATPLLAAKSYPLGFGTATSFAAHTGKKFDLIPNAEYLQELNSPDAECNGKFQILRVNRNNAENHVGKSLIFIYESTDAFIEQRDEIMELEDFTVGMGSMDIFGSHNAAYMQERTGIKFYRPVTLEVAQMLMLRKFGNDKHKIQIECFYTIFDNDKKNKTYFIVIRVYPKDEKWTS